MNQPPLTVQLARVDYTVAEKFIGQSLRRSGPWYWLVRLLEVAVGLLGFLGFSGLFRLNPSLEASVQSQAQRCGLLLLSALALYMVTSLLSKRSAGAVLFSSKSKLLEPFQVTVNDLGLSIETSTGRTEVPWRSIERAEVSGRYLFLFTFPHQAIVLPESAFDSSSEFRVFAESAAQRVAQNAG